MSFLVILIFAFVSLLLLAYKLFSSKRSNNDVLVLDEQNDRKPGFVNIDISDATTIAVSLAQDNIHVFKNQNRVNNIVVEKEHKNNRYCYYDCKLSGDKKITLNLKLNNRVLIFNNAYALTLNEANQIFTGIEFDVEFSNSKVSLEQAFSDYKRYMQQLLDWGCQNYFGLATVRYKKEQYNKLLESGDHHCIAPDLIQFDEFKTVLNSDDFSSLDSYFYLDGFLIWVFYNPNYSASFEIRKANSLESSLSYFGNDDLYLDELSEEELQLKFKSFLDGYLLQRIDEEENAKAEGFEIDENYIDPFVKFESFKNKL